MRQKTAEIIADAQAEVDEAAERIRQTETECQEMREQAAQEIKRQRSAFFKEMRQILRDNPELAAQMRKAAKHG